MNFFMTIGFTFVCLAMPIPSVVNAFTFDNFMEGTKKTLGDLNKKLEELQEGETDQDKQSPKGPQPSQNLAIRNQSASGSNDQLFPLLTGHNYSVWRISRPLTASVVVLQTPRPSSSVPQVQSSSQTRGSSHTADQKTIFTQTATEKGELLTLKGKIMMIAPEANVLMMRGTGTPFGISEDTVVKAKGRSIPISAIKNGDEIELVYIDGTKTGGIKFGITPFSMELKKSVYCRGRQ